MTSNRVIFDEEIFNKLRIQPVGNGLIDLICPFESIQAFVKECEERNILIKGFTWWCHVTEDHKPCGMGGPQSKYFYGWFSEIPMEDLVRFNNNNEYLNYLKNVWPTEKEYHKCYWPAFWLSE